MKLIMMGEKPRVHLLNADCGLMRSPSSCARARDTTRPRSTLVPKHVHWQDPNHFCYTSPSASRGITRLYRECALLIWDERNWSLPSGQLRVPIHVYMYDGPGEHKGQIFVALTSNTNQYLHEEIYYCT